MWVTKISSLSLTRVCPQRRRISVQVFHQHKRHRDVRRQRHVVVERHRDVRRQRHVVVDGHLPKLVRRRRAIFPVRRAELFDAVRVVDLRRLSTQPRQSQSVSLRRHFFCV